MGVKEARLWSLFLHLGSKPLLWADCVFSRTTLAMGHAHLGAGGGRGLGKGQLHLRLSLCTAPDSAGCMGEDWTPASLHLTFFSPLSLPWLEASMDRDQASGPLWSPSLSTPHPQRTEFVLWDKLPLPPFHTQLRKSAHPSSPSATRSPIFRPEPWETRLSRTQSQQTVPCADSLGNSQINHSGLLTSDPIHKILGDHPSWAGAL